MGITTFIKNKILCVIKGIVSLGTVYRHKFKSVLAFQNIGAPIGITLKIISQKIITEYLKNFRFGKSNDTKALLR